MGKLSEVFEVGYAEGVYYAKLKTDCTFSPKRSAAAYGYGLTLDASEFLLNSNSYGAAKKNYILYITGSKYGASTGDSNDAYIRVNANNYAASDTSFIWRGINIGINNRSGGVCIMDNSIGIQNKSGGTCGTMTGLTVTAENYGTVSDVFGCLDLVLRNEGAVATTEFGLRIRNTNVSLGTAVGSAIHISNTATNTGFTNLIYAADCDLVPTSTTVTIIRFKGANGKYVDVNYTDGAEALVCVHEA